MEIRCQLVQFGHLRVFSQFDDIVQDSPFPFRKWTGLGRTNELSSAQYQRADTGESSQPTDEPAPVQFTAIRMI